MPKLGSNWTCPYCQHAQVIHDERQDIELKKIWVKGYKDDEIGYYLESVVCSNVQCKELTLNLSLLLKGKDHANGRGFDIRGKIKDWKLLPASSAKPQPEYIPIAIAHDYEEACAIRDLSPKASATLIRRCIQGIIRDFCQIKKARLIDEINELRSQVNNGKAPAGVQADTVQAIDDVRKIGNIAAHMEADVNVIVDVDPDEAQILIELAELLFEEWYVARQLRSNKIARLSAIASSKAAQQQAGKASASQTPP